MMIRLRCLVALAAIFAANSFAQASTDWALTTAQFRTRNVHVNAIDTAGVHLADAEASAAVLDWQQVLELSRASQKHSSATTKPGERLLNLYLNGGDHCMGNPVSLADEKLAWNDVALGSVSFASNQLAAISMSELPVATISQSRSDDVVRLANGDVAHGIISQIDANGVGLQTGGTSTVLPWDSIAAVLIATPPASTKNPRQFRVWFSNGSILSFSDLSLGDSSCSLVMPDKSAHEINTAMVNRIEQINGPVSWLTSRRATENIYRPFFSESFPARFDATVDAGTSISEKFPGFHHGIGCHSYSRLSYALDGSYAAMRTQFVIDSESALADVTVRILLDDKVAYEKKNVKAGPIAPVVTLSLGSARSLTLEVDYGENYATEDRFVWLDPALLRIAPP